MPNFNGSYTPNRGPTGSSVGSMIGKIGGGIFGMGLGGPIGALGGAYLGNKLGGLAGAGLSSLFGPNGISSGLSGISLLTGRLAGGTQGSISPGGIAFGNVPQAASAAAPTPSVSQTVGAGPSLGHFITQMGQGVTGYGAEAMSEVRKRNLI